MPSGRHLLILGLLAGAGLLSVRISQDQIALAYEIARCEARLRKAHEEQVTENARFQALRIPTRVMDKVAEMHLPLTPPNSLSLFPSNGLRYEASGDRGHGSNGPAPHP